MPIARIAEELWRWFAETGINLALLVVVALLIPRAARFANRVVERQVSNTRDADEVKTRLAIAGVGINIAQIIAFFLLLVFLLQQMGFSLAGAAIPATVVSAAVGFGAQNIIADFLAGFFILTEKQFGVGDHVSFEGGGLDVSGTVIQITMRSTHIRTLEQATVSIPNSAARIAVNYSNYWSSALVVMPVPLLGSDSAEEAIERAEKAARKTLATPEIAPTIMGDLEVHPAVDVNPPATVGMPWTMDVRLMIRVEPLSQWMVERALRVALLNEFWDEYGSAPTTVGTRMDHVIDHTEAAEAFPVTGRVDPAQVDPAQAAPARTRPTASAHPGEDDSLAGSESPTEALSSRPAAASAAASAQGGDTTEAAQGAGDADDTAAGEQTDSSNDPETELITHPDDDPASDMLADEAHKQTKLAFGGRMRMSTAVLLGVFLVLLVVRGLTIGPTEDDPDRSGVLAPPPRTTPAATTSQTPAPATQSTPAPSPTQQPSQPAETSQAPATGTPQQQPSSEQQPSPQQQPSNEQQPAPTSAQQAPSAPSEGAPGNENAPQSPAPTEG
ncbi:mechanosensitive ion channel domain-containing protein [Corynebacterium timonense]|uniref:Small conductance mechanosensitive channel n=1 Tax=Corynebacterium timonense TaxID=441500 RepID=A0A1H1PYI0_9CORY|nr:mechanosensitive ion channel domain-containing protein [Corynebacterium timonense]SDS16411.1 small conductance mechanosensitive channel [Corynebacterium timonense]